MPLSLFKKIYKTPTAQTLIHIRWRYVLWQLAKTVVLLLSALWLLAAIWYQVHYLWLRWLLMLCITLLILSIVFYPIFAYWQSKKHKQNNQKNSHTFKRIAPRMLLAVYGSTWLLAAIWFVTLAPKQNRDWKDEVAHNVSYRRDNAYPNLVTLHNVRNFDWLTADKAVPHWQNRTVDISKLSGVNIVNSYWMGPAIAHTLISFEFEDDRPLAFSFKIRKEQHESFSAIGGFFKQYELSLIASEERDIIYTRSNARSEQVYFFPLHNITKTQLTALFIAYLKAADQLQERPAWYNTLTSNCTNIIFYMGRLIDKNKLPWDYRIWASGYLPNYLYDVHLLPNTTDRAKPKWNMATWYKNAHINPKVVNFSFADNASLTAYSRRIRQGLPKATLKHH